MAIPYTKRMLVERVRRHMANDFPNEEFSIFESEVLLYIDQALSSTLVSSMMGIAKVTGSMATPEGYVITTQLAALVQNNNTGEWYATLPQTPISLSLGYSITNAYLANPAYGQSQPIWLIKNKRVPYRRYMPSPNGVSGRVLGNVFYVKANDNTPLSNLNVFVDMVTTRTTDINAPMNLPDDAIESIFQKVVVMCKDRINMPSDLIKDNVSAGNKSS